MGTSKVGVVGGGVDESHPLGVARLTQRLRVIDAATPTELLYWQCLAARNEWIVVFVDKRRPGGARRPVLLDATRSDSVDDTVLANKRGLYRP